MLNEAKSKSGNVKWLEGSSERIPAEDEAFDFSEVDDLGEITINDAYMDIHIDEVLNLSLVDIEAVKAAKLAAQPAQKSC